MTKLILVSAALASMVLPTAAFAQASAPCLQANQIFASSALDERTMIVNDKFNRTYVVHLRGACRGLTTIPRGISFYSPSNQQCLGPNDRISFRHQTVGRNTCFVDGVSTDLGSIASINRPFSRVN